MDLQKLQEDYERRANDKQDWYNGGYWTDIDSGTNYLGTLGYLNDQQQHDEENWKPLKSFYNGFVVQGGRGIVGAMQMLRDKNIKAHQEQDPNYKVNDEAVAILDNAMNSNILTPYQIKAEDTADKVIYGLVEGAGQLASQVIVSGLTGGTGAALYMGAQIAGNQYSELRAQGVDAERAFNAALVNAIIQAPMEKFSLGKMFKALPAGSKLRQKAIQVLESAVTEGVTESLQELPEQLTDIWAKNEGMSAREIGREWDKNAVEHIKDMVFSGVIGGLLGGGASGINVTINSIREKTAQKANAELVKSMEDNAEQIKASGINPKYAAYNIDGQGTDVVSVDAAVIKNGLSQEAELRKVADSLGVTAEQITEAAANGQDISVTRGNLTATMASINGFAQTVHDHISFNDGANSINYAEMKKDLNAAYEASEQAAGELDTELDRIVTSAKEAGVAQPQAEGLRTILESRAMIANPNRPAAWLKKHALDFVNAGKRNPVKGLYQTSGIAEAKLVADEKSFADSVDALMKNALPSGKPVKVMTTPLALKAAGAPLLPVEIEYSDLYKVVAGKHSNGMSASVLKQLPRALTDPLMIFKSYDGKNGERRIVVALDLKDAKGANIVVPFELKQNSKNNKYYLNLLKSAYGKTDNKTGKPSYEYFRKQIENGNILYANKKRITEWNRAVGLYLPMEETTSNSLTDIISEHNKNYKDESELERLKKEYPGYYQESGEKTKGTIEPQEDGRYVISLFKGADASTVIHETGHYFFDTFMKDSALPDADARMKRDRQRLLDYVGMTEEQWNAADLDGRRAAHERAAEAFETYIMEGKAPARNLRGVFNRFSKWLKAVYEKYVRSNNAVPLTPEVRDVFDHWLAANMDIQQAAKAEGILGKLPDAVTKNLSDTTKQWLADKIIAAKDEAVNKLSKEYMRNFSKERRKAIADFRAQITPDIEKQVAEIQVNQARDAVADMFSREHTKKFRFEAFDVLTVKQKMFLAANPNVIARKYKNALDPEYKSMKEYLAELNKEIDDRLNPIIEELKSGYGHGVEEYWTDLETGEEADVGGLKSEKSTGLQYRKERFSKNAPWYQKWYAENGHAPTKTELRKLAYDLYTGVDKYGFYGDINLFGSIQEANEFEAMAKELKAEIDELIADRDALANDPNYQKLKQRSKLSDEDVISFELIADEMGYDSGDAMATAILEEPSAKQMVRERVEQSINTAFPDVAKERELAEAATLEALYNDDSGVVIALEQQLIEDAANKALDKERSQQEREVLAKARKAAVEVEARNALLKMTMSDALKAGRFAMAERRAAANAQRALKKGDTEAAIEYKFQQAISHAMVRRSVKLKQEVEDNKKFVRKLRTMKKENFGTEQHLNQIGAFLARMGLQRRDYNPTNRTQTLQQYLDEMREKLGDMVVSGNDDWPSFILDDSYDLRNSNALSIEEYENVIDMLKQLYKISKQDTKVTREDKDTKWQADKAATLAALSKHKTVYEPAPGEPEKMSRIKRLIWSRLNADSMFEKMDNWTQGYFSKAWYGMLKHCADKEALLVMDREERDTSAKKKWLQSLSEKGGLLGELQGRKAVGQKRYYEELGASCDKATLIQMACNLGNDSNAKRLCETTPLGFKNSSLWIKPNAQINADEAIKLTKQNLLDFLGKALTKADLEYAQAKIDNCDRFWRQLAEVNRKTKGFAPQKVEAVPVAITLANGEKVLLKGGYFPLVSDNRDKAQSSIADTDANPAGNISTMTTNSGSSKARTDAKYPVSLIPDAEMITMRNTIHDICYREAMIYFRKNINDPEIFSMLKSKMGVEGVRVLREMLEKCANPYSNTNMDFAEGMLADIANWIRKKTVNAIIVLNFKIPLQNIGNVFLYGNTVEGFTYADVISAIPDMFNPANYKNNREIVFAKSPFMRERAQLPDVTMRDIKNSSGLSFIEKKGMEWGAALLERTDNFTAIPVWMKAYNNKIAQGASEQAAVDFADTVIRRTLGSSRIQDVASMQRGGPLFKLFTSFQGFFNTQFNQWYREAHIDYNLASKGEWRKAAMRASTFFISKVLLACLANVFLGGEGDPFEEDKKGWKKITKELMTYPITVVSGPGGQAASVLFQQMLGMENYGYRMSLVQNTVEKGIRFGYKSGKVISGDKEATELIEPAAELLAIAFNVPLQFIRTGGNIIDIMYNDMTFEMQDIIRRRPKSER